MYIALLIFFGGIDGAWVEGAWVSGYRGWCVGVWACGCVGRVGVWCVGVCPYRCVDPLV